MKCSALVLALLLLLHIIPIRASFSVGGGISFGIIPGSDGGRGGGGGGNSIGGVANNQNRAFSALQTWKLAITDDPSGILSTWVGSDVCSYKGVYCTDSKPWMSRTSGSGLSVTGIDLNKANLQGTLVKELCYLNDLTFLHLNSNRFSGNVPETFRQLIALEELDLSNNNFSGRFPLSTLYIPKLIYLDLRFNYFYGSIPEELFFMRLDAIFINNNQFDGEIPKNLGNSPASVINLANNKFSGAIPASFGIMGPRLKEILFLNNQLTGCIPEGVGFLSAIEVLDVSYNKLMGHLPDTFSCLNEVEILNLAHNELSGVVSDMICSLKSLVNLSVANNFFSGFTRQCQNLFTGNAGNGLSFNCIPGWNMQRPPAECFSIPGMESNCPPISGIPTPPVCGLLGERPATIPSSSSSSP